jgi:phage shock protein PspC (stress-responsive transcriptional regulator)
VSEAAAHTRRAPLSAVLLGGCGLVLIGIGLYFSWWRPALLPEDTRYIGAGLGELLSVAPGMGRWLHRVFWVLGGYITATGILTVYLAATAFRTRDRGARAAVAVAGFASSARWPW